MQLDDPFPIESFPLQVREAILSEFSGHHPTVLEVIRVPDTHWLKVPRMGPVTLAKLRHMTRGMRGRVRAPSLSGWTSAELLTERKRLQDEVKGTRDKLKEITAELRLRGLLAPH